MKKIFSSFVLASTITLSNLSAITSEYITYEKDILTKIENKQYINSHKDVMSEILETLKEADYEFTSKVTVYLFKTNQEWVKSNSQRVGQNLAVLALHLKDKKKSYKNIQRLFSKDKDLKSLNVKLSELINDLILMETKIQNLIDISYMGIEAKSIFPLVKSILEKENIIVDDYWYSLNIEEDKPLFIISKSVETFNIERISELEDKLNKELKEFAKLKEKTLFKLPKIDNFNFNSINENFFKRVSFI